MSTEKMKRDDVRQILLSLVLARKGATAIPVLDNDYYQAEKMRIPWRQFGYANLLEFIRSMPEHFVVQFYNGNHYVRGIASEKSKHVSSLVSRQKQNTMKYLPPRFQNRYPLNYSVPRMHIRRIPAEQLNILVQYVKSYPNGVSMQTAMLVMQKQLPHVVLTMHDLQQQLHELTHQIYLDGEIIRPVKSENNNYYRKITNHQPLLSQEDVARSTAEVTYGVPGDESDANFNHNGDSIRVDFVDHDIKGLKEGEQLETNFNREQMYDHRHDSDDVDEYITDTEKSEHYERNDMSKLISERTRSRLEKLMRKNPDGIWCTELPQKYLEEYKVSLNYSNLGFNSVRQYVACLPEIFYMKQHITRDDFILFSADTRPKNQDQLSKSYIQELSGKNVHETTPTTESDVKDLYNLHDVDDDDDIAPFPSDVNVSVFEKFAPRGAMAYDESVGQILVTDLNCGRKKFLESYVVEVFTPSFFWIHLRQNRKYLNALMDDLGKFYKQNSETYAIPKLALKRGLNCACLYDNIWHRGIIKTVKPDFRVTVMCYDYGTLKTYAPEEVYYLHNKFSHLAAQAIPCGLYNIRPNVGDRWKKSITNRFVERISERLLAATIISIDPPNNSMLIVLTDTSEENDVHINDWLVQENLARRGKMGDAVDMASIMNYVVNNLNQVPTYCYAEENLVVDSYSKATSTEEFVELSTFSPGQTVTCYNNNSQPKLRQPSDIELANSSNMTNYFNTNSYSALGCASSIKAPFSNMTEANTANNPFLVEDPPQPVMNEVDFNETTKKKFMQIWQENMHLQVKLLEMFRNTLKRSPTCKFMLNNHLMVQYQFNRIYKIFEQALITDENEAITTSNLLRSETTNNIDVQRLLKSNSENFISQKVADLMSNTLAMINPFNDFYKPIHQTAYNLTSDLSHTTCTRDIVQSACRDGINRSQADESSSYVQMPPVTLTPSSLISNNYESMSSMMPTVSNTDISSVNRCPPGFFQNVNTEYVCSQQKNKDPPFLKETNPFKLCLASELQMSQTQNEHTIGYDTTISTSCLSDRNLQNYSPKMEFATNYNPHRRYENFPTNESKSGFAPTGSTGFTEVTGPASVNVNHDDNYTSKIVYKASPVMYNTQKKKAEADITNKASSCNGYSNDTAQNSLHSGQYNKKEQLSHPVHRPNTSPKYIDIRQPECINIIPHDMRNVSSTLGDNSTLNNENYIDTTYQNRSSLQNHRNSNCSLTMTNPSPYKEWNTSHGKECLIRNMNGTINPIPAFQFDSVNNENAVIMYANLLSLFFEEQKSTDYTNVPPYTHNTLNTGFSFRRIDSVKGVTIIFHMEENGWILTYEFAEAFTNFKSYSDLISILQTINLTTVLKNIQRSDYPVQFLQLDSYPLKAIRDSEHRITDINLISLPAVLVLLWKLRIISYEEIYNALKKNKYIEGSVMHNMWVLANTYKAFKQRIGQYNISYNT